MRTWRHVFVGAGALLALVAAPGVATAEGVTSERTAWVISADAKAAQKNLALVRSGAYKQRRCPVTGGALASGTALNIGGVNVLFSSSAARLRVAKAGAKARIQLVFGPRSFAKAFAPK